MRGEHRQRGQPVEDEGGRLAEAQPDGVGGGGDHVVDKGEVGGEGGAVVGPAGHLQGLDHVAGGERLAVVPADAAPQLEKKLEASLLEVVALGQHAFIAQPRRAVLRFDQRLEDRAVG